MAAVASLAEVHCLSRRLCRAVPSLRTILAVEGVSEALCEEGVGPMPECAHVLGWVDGLELDGVN